MPSEDKLAGVLSQAEQIWDEASIQKAIDAIASNMVHLASSRPLMLVVMNGGLIFAGQLLPRLPFPVQVDYVHASRYGQSTQGGGLTWERKPASPLKNRTVVLLDDIYDEGKTLLTLREYCLEEGAREVLTCVLLDKRHNRKSDPTFKPDYVGLEVPDKFVFGYGLDYKGQWRNAPGIYAIEE